MVTALGKKLYLSLFLQACTDLKRLPEGNRLKRWKPGWVVSFRVFLALLRRREYKPEEVCRNVDFRRKSRMSYLVLVMFSDNQSICSIMTRVPSHKTKHQQLN